MKQRHFRVVVHATKEFTASFNEDAVDTPEALASWKEVVTAEVTERVETQLPCHVERVEIEEVTTQVRERRFRRGDAVEFWHGGPGAELDVLVVLEQSADEIEAFSTQLWKPVTVSAERITPMREEVGDWTIGGNPHGNTMKELVEAARKEIG